MRCIVVRGANGVIAWKSDQTDAANWLWTCTRDGFSIPQVSEESKLESTATQLAQHSVSIVGAIAQVVELDL